MFEDFKIAVQQRFNTMKGHDLFRTQVEKDLLWETYLSSFPEGSNPLFRERTEHDCQCCKQFIRAVGSVVAIVDGELVSIWDTDICDPNYQVVSDAMAALVKAAPIADVLLHDTKNVGTDKNFQELEGGEVATWEHFCLTLPSKFVLPGDAIGTKLAEIHSTKDVFLRSLTEITLDAVEAVLELIDQNSLYRGEENWFAVNEFQGLQNHFHNAVHEDLFAWEHCTKIPASVSRIRGTSIGTLLVDLSEGKELDQSVASFEAKVAPSNYKRPTALITKGMIKKAQQQVEELGLTSALERRYAVVDDITVNNVLHANRAAKQAMGVFDELAHSATENVKSLEKVEEVDIKTFIDSILPKAESLELLFENSHARSLFSLVAPVDAESKGMLKWHNNFSWAYAGELADSMKERVKAAGGDVTGDLRFSIQWNDEGVHNESDYDAHCQTPTGVVIKFNNTFDCKSGGSLDVDIQQPRQGKPAVENITFPSRSKMPEGTYKLLVHNYSKRSGDSGFRAEIEFDGVIQSFNYPKTLRQDEKVCVAKVAYSHKDGFTIYPELSSAQSVREEWGIKTQQFHKVSLVMNSPNHWDDRATGNKHYFFVLENCLNEGKARGFFNEFLTDELRDHRKVFEVLGSKMKTEESDNQLSGLGFSSTQRNHVFCRVAGSFNRVIKITF